MSVGAIRAGRAMVEIFADSSMLARGLATAQGRIAKFAQTLRRLGTAQVAMGSALAIPLIAAVSQYAQIEQRLNTVRALTGATAAQMRGLAATVRQIGMASGMAFTQVAEAMGELSRAGVGIESLDDATRAVSEFSRAAGIEMGEAANVTVQILTQFGLGMDHIVRVTDVLQEMANATVSTVEALADGFRYAGQSSNLFGLSLEQAAAAIATLQQTGLSASTAGTSLNQFLLQMVQNLDKLEAAIGGLRGADGEFLPMVEILAKLQAAVANMPGPERLQFLNEMFDVRGMRGAEALLQNVEMWLNLTAQAENSMGATARKAREMSQAFLVSFEKMRNAAVMLGYAVGEALDGELRGYFEVVSGAASGIASFVSANKEAVVSVLRLSAGLVTSGAAFFSAGLAIQLALFSVEGFAKLGAAALAPFKMMGSAIAGVASWVAGAAGSLVNLTIALARATAGWVAYAAAQSAALVVNVATSALPLVSTLSYALTLVTSLGRGLSLGLAIAIPAAIALAVALAAVSAAFSGVLSVAGGLAGVAALLARSLGQGLAAGAQTAGRGLVRVFDGLVDRSREVWPEMLQMASSAWSGIVAALKQGDIGAAWGIFTAAARAAFAQVMIIIGPFVDDAIDLLSMIGTALSDSFFAAYEAISPLISAIGSALADAFNAAADSGAETLEWLGVSIGGLGDIAEEAGNRIYNALSAGDIVQAWAAAATAIRKMMISIGGWWDQNVAQRVRLFGQEMGTWGRRSEIRDRARAEPDGSRAAVEGIFDAQSDAEVDAIIERFGGLLNEAGEIAVRDAARLRKEELKAAGVMTPEQRQADIDRQLAEAEADYQKDAEDRRKRREEARDRRRKEADEAAADVGSRSASAREGQRNAQLRADIAGATDFDELDDAQGELNQRRRERQRAEAGFGADAPGEVDAQMREADSARIEAENWIDNVRQSISQALEDGLITESEAESQRQDLTTAEQALDAARTAEDVWRTVGDVQQRWADGIKSGGVVPGPGESLRGPRAAQEDADESFGRADAAADAMAGAQAADNARRAEESRKLRVEAAERRREGDERGAEALERAADSLDQALDSRESADLQGELDARRAELQRQQDLRDQVKRGGGQAQQDAGKRRLDSIGGFVNKGFDRLGFGTNLADNDQRRAADAAEGMLAIMRRNEGNAGVFS
jgi:TP901 family phage tail tape measure protein